MLEVFGLLTVVIGLAYLLVPVFTFLRMRALTAQVAQLEGRLQAIERERSDGGRAARPESPIPTIESEASSRPAVVPQVSEAASAAEPFAAAREPQAATATSAGTATPAIASGGGEALGLEERLGGRALLYAGVLILLLGVSFFLKYAFDNAWVGPWARVLLGIGAGLALTAGGLRLERRGLRAFGLALAGAGAAALYLAVYAAASLYMLVGPSPGFIGMVLVTAIAAALANRLRAESLATIALAGGFSTPFLVGGDRGGMHLLFAYLALLVAGTSALVRRHRWMALAALAYVLTVAVWIAWSPSEFADARWLATLLWLSVFVALFGALLPVAHRTAGWQARAVEVLLWSAPLLYHAAALVLTTRHPPAAHVYLIAFTIVALLTTAKTGQPELRLAALLLVVLPLFGGAALPTGSSWLIANVTLVLAICALHLLALLERARGPGLTTTGLVTLQVTGLACFGLLHQLVSPVYPAVRGGLAFAAAGGAALLWRGLQTRDRLASLDALALAFTLLGIAITLQFDGRPVVVGWAVEGVAIAWVGFRVPSIVFRVGGLLLWAAAALKLTDGYFATPTNFTAVVNERSLATAAVVGLGYLLSTLFARDAGNAGRSGAARAGLHVACSLLSLLWISGEIRSYWEVRYERAQAYLYEQLLLSLGWGLYGAGAIVVGLQRRYAPLRYIGIAVIGVTVLKVFFVDLWDLGGIYRVIGFLSLGVLLVLVSYLYQRRATTPAQASAGSGVP